ncbi:MAG: hypothetical protein LBD58_08070 [Treponema sp.]|nr:hypothetical protein [Treponema sp.]
MEQIHTIIDAALPSQARCLWITMLMIEGFAAAGVEMRMIHQENAVLA